MRVWLVDMVQETWLRLSHYQLGREIRHPRALLLRIATNLALDRAARRGRRSQILETTWVEDQQGVLPGQTEDLLVKELILGLPEPLRDVFLLSRVDGLTNAQIGEKLGISPKTVEWRMTRALAHCAAQLRR
jgi:RNA polymerase sigma factor (sigma-70 family)